MPEFRGTKNLHIDEPELHSVRDVVTGEYVITTDAEIASPVRDYLASEGFVEAAAPVPEPEPAAAPVPEPEV